MKKGLLAILSMCLLLSGCTQAQNNDSKYNGSEPPNSDNGNVPSDDEENPSTEELTAFPEIESIKKVYDSYVDLVHSLENAKVYSYQEWVYMLKGNRFYTFDTFSGETEPDISVGKLDDMYVNTKTNEIYHKDGGDWLLVYSLDYEKIYEIEKDYIDGNYTVYVKTFFSERSFNFPILFVPSKINDLVINGTSQRGFSRNFPLGESTIKAIYFLEGTSKIECESFAYNYALEYVYFPSSLKTIEFDAFKDCVSLNNVDLSNVATVGDNVFKGCTSLTNINYNPESVHFESAPNFIKEFKIPSDWTEIPDSYFTYCEKLESITIPSNIKKIGFGAFYGCKMLKTISFENGVETIDSQAFYECVSLKSIVLPDSLVEIGRHIFCECSNLEEVVLSSNLKTLNDYTFKFCRSLKRIDLKNVETINVNAFHCCESLQSLVIPKTVKEINASCFYGCSVLENVSVESENNFYDSRDNCNAIFETSTNTLIYGSNATVVPNSIEAFGDYAFAGKTNITSFVVPDNITKLPVGLFSDCVNLKKVVLPKTGFKSIFGKCFLNCSNLEDINIPNTVTYFGESAFEGCGKIKNFEFCTTGSCSIGEYAFKNCLGLSSLFIPRQVNLNGYSCFEGCYNIETIVVEDNNVNGFYSKGSNCIISKKGTVYAGSKNSTFPSSVESIPTGVFTGNPYIKSVNIDHYVQINSYAFKDCTGLESVDIHSIDARDPYYGRLEGIFENCTNLKSVNFSDSQKIIGYYWFYNCKSLENFDFKSIEILRNGAFNGCSSLKSIHIPATLTSLLPAPVFDNCSGIEEITVSSSNTHYYCHDNCNAIICNLGGERIPTIILGCKNTIVTNDIKAIGSNAFCGCSELETIALPSTLTEIDDFAFKNCVNLTSITIPENTKWIGEGIFSNCNKLRSIKIDENNPYFDTSNKYNLILGKKDNCIYAGCNASIIPYGAASIHDYAFAGLTEITSLKLPKTICEIYNDAFSNCINIKEVYIPIFVKEIQVDAFKGVTNCNFYFEGDKPVDFYENFCDFESNNFYYNCKM